MTRPYRLMTPDQASKELARQLAISSEAADERVRRYLDTATAQHGVPLDGWRVDDDDLDLIRGFRLDEQPIDYVQAEGWEHGPDAATWSPASVADVGDVHDEREWDDWFTSGADAAHAEWLDSLARVNAPVDAVDRARAAVAALPLVLDEDPSTATAQHRCDDVHTDVDEEGDQR